MYELAKKVEMEDKKSGKLWETSNKFWKLPKGQISKLVSTLQIQTHLFWS